jgi:hypothetical protein
MGEAKTRLERFRKQGHRHCAYCGGVGAVESIDHVPPTAFFRNKHRPAWLETPACNQCHRPLSDFDSLFSFICKLVRSTGNGDSDSRHLTNLAVSSIRKFEDLVAPMLGTAKAGVIRNATGAEEVVILDEIPSELILAMAFVAARTTAALYYHIADKVLPLGAEIHTFVLTSHHVNQQDFNHSLIHGLPNYGTMMQGPHIMSDQFEYKYLWNENQFYCCHNFKGSIVSWGFVDPSIQMDVAKKLTFLITEKGIRPQEVGLSEKWISRGIFERAI